MSNYNKYIGLEHSDSFDCLALVKLVLKEQHGLQIDEINPADWLAVGEAAEGDVVQFERGGVVYHWGIMVSATHFLHSQTSVGASIARLDSSEFMIRFEGLHRHRSKAQ